MTQNHLFELIAEASERTSPEHRCENCVAWNRDFTREMRKDGTFKYTLYDGGRCYIINHHRNKDRFCGLFYSRFSLSPVLRWTLGENQS